MLDLGAKRDLPTLLLIDDDLVSREVMATVLTMSGYTVHTAPDGAASLAMLDDGDCVPQAILMDAQMPGLCGPKLIAELRARSQAVVLAISASSPADEEIASADGFLLKPFSADALQAMLNDRLPLPALSAEQAQTAEEPAINAEILAQLRGLMSEAAVREIYAAVVADLGRRIVAIEDALSRDDAAEVRRLGHAIKGGCGMVGALQAARLGARLEADPAVTTGNHLDNSASLLRELRTATRNLERMLDAELPV